MCWAAALGLGTIDNVRGAYFQATNLLRSLDAGEPYRAARALALEVPFVAVPGISTRRRALELLAEAHRIAQRTGHPHALALVRLVSGTSLYLVGRFPEGRDPNSSIAPRRCSARPAPARPGSAARALLHRPLVPLVHRRFNQPARRVPLAIREAEERGDCYLATNLRSYYTNAHWLVQGDVEGARREAALAIERWSKAGFHLQHMHDMVAQAHIALYEGAHREAHRVLAGRWPALEASLSLRMQTARVHMVHLRARTALASAGRAPRPAELPRAPRAARRGAPRRARPRRRARALGRAAGRFAPRRGRRHPRRRADRARRARQRRARLPRPRMELFAAAVRRRAGALLGGERGAALAGEAARWMTAQGVVDPDWITAMLAPGFR